MKEFARGDRRVVCSACKLVNSETGQETLLIGPRHYCPTMCAQWDIYCGGKLGEGPWWTADEYGQGFIDQWGVYMSREEAWVVATAAGQIIYTGPGFEGPRLFSENLY